MSSPAPSKQTPLANRTQRPTASSREYVVSADLADVVQDWLEGSPDRTLTALADAANVSPRAISKVMLSATAGASGADLRTDTVFLADALMTAMGRHLSELRGLRAPTNRAARQVLVQALLSSTT
jgi:hypothetical protein